MWHQKDVTVNGLPAERADASNELVQDALDKREKTIFTLGEVANMGDDIRFPRLASEFRFGVQSHTPALPLREILDGNRKHVGLFWAQVRCPFRLPARRI